MIGRRGLLTVVLGSALACLPASAREDQLQPHELVWHQRFVFIQLDPARRPYLQQRLGLSDDDFREVDSGAGPGGRSVYRLPKRYPVVGLTAPYRFHGKIPFRYAEPEIVERRRSEDPRELYAGYKDDVVSNRILRYLERRYPSHAKVYEIGKSVQGRPILALKISDNVALEEDEPAFLFNATHHGNEPLTPDFAIDVATVLLSGLDGPESPDKLLELANAEFRQSFFHQVFLSLKPRYRPGRMRSYVEDFEIWVVPVVNPDGLSAFWNKDTGMGRKNGRETAPPLGHDRRDGVDLNRNYPFYWKSGNPRASSDRPDNYYYRGPKAASEPETRAMMALAERQRFVMALSYHSWATKVLVPYTIDEVMNPFPHVAWQIGEKLAAAGVSFLPDRDYEAAKNLYAVDGTDEDWLHHKYGTMAYIIESSFHTPIYEKHGTLCIQGMRPLSLRALELYRLGPVLSVRVHRPGPDENQPGPALPNVRIRVKDFAYFEGEKTFTNSHGRYDFFLPGPGEYTLEAIRDRTHRTRQKVRCDRGVCDVQITLTGP